MNVRKNDIKSRSQIIHEKIVEIKIYAMIIVHTKENSHQINCHELTCCCYHFYIIQYRISGPFCFNKYTDIEKLGNVQF